MGAMSQTRRAEPERTCAGCREQDAQSALLRFAVREQSPRLVPDPRKRLPGRGVSVHPRRRCLERAARGGGFARSLRAPIEVDLEELCSLIESGYDARMRGLVASALRTRRVSLGTDAVKAALHDGSARLLIFAVDAAGRRSELTVLAKRLTVPVVTHGTKSELGRLTRRAELGVLAILDQRIASELSTVASRAQDLSEAE